MKKINLKAYTFPAKNLNYSAGDILRKARQNQELNRIKQSKGCVTFGILEATQVEGGYGWAISEYIEFNYKYISRPNFSWGLDGTAGIDYTTGGNTYSKELPPDLLAFYSEAGGWDANTYQPAMFIPRVIHWHIEDNVFLGCYLLVCQVNSECTELDKTVRIHYAFTGKGY